MKRSWFRHGFLNLLEHGFSRLADAGLSFFLIWLLPTEIFSRLAVSQAAVAPLLLFFIAPEQVIYRDYGIWKQEGLDRLASRIRSLRVLALAKVPVALVIAAILAITVASGSRLEAFFAAVWAFALVLVPQICGPDREYLRLSLRLKSLNALSLLQKAILVLLTLVASWIFPARLGALAAAAWLALGISAWVARWTAERGLRRDGATEAGLLGQYGPSPWRLLRDGVGSFSVWNHLVGVVQNTVQTLDLLLLGVFGAPALELGLYGTVLKIANFSQAVPLAFSNLFGVWIGRRAGHGDPESLESRRVLQASALLLISSLAMAAILWTVAPWALEALSRGRWDQSERVRMMDWLSWILAGNVALCASLAAGSWLVLRRSPRTVLGWISMPWALVALAIYVHEARVGADAVARANLPVGLAGLLLTAIALGRARLKAPSSLAAPTTADSSHPAG